MKKMVLVWLLVLWTGLAWAQPPVPLLWKVSGAQGSVYLLGSFHLLKESDYPLAPSVDAALADVKEVYFEVSPQEAQSPALAEKMNRVAMRTNGKTLQQSLSPKTWTALQAYAAKNQMSLEPLQSFKPWFIAVGLTMAEFMKLGFSPAVGLDQYFMTRAEQTKKPAWGLETADAQITLLDGMDAATQGDFLTETLIDLQDMPTLVGALHDAWRQGDDAALDRLGSADMRARFPKLYQQLLVDRNRAWLPKLEVLLQPGASGNALVVVGALHLVGRDGLVQMLQARGYRVQRLR